jgi:hypothetical protein
MIAGRSSAGASFDLTPAGARALGMDGLAHVSVEVVGGKS